MINLFGLCLIVTSLTTAGIWYPSQENLHKDKDDDLVIVKQGHRVVVVEYGDNGQHADTKVSISPETETESESESESSRHGTRDLICDAFGKCKHKIASAMEKAKVMVSESVQDVSEAFDKAKEAVSEKVHGDESVELETESDVVEKRRIVDRGIKVVKDGLNYIVESAKGKEKALIASMNVLSLLGFGMALGMGVWNTFISSYVLSNAIPSRQQLGVVQSKIYPVYFRAMASTIGMALLPHLFPFPFPFQFQFQAYLLSAALFMTLLNSLYMEPQATKVMFEKLKMEKEEGIEEPRHVTDTRSQLQSKMVGLNQRLKKLNSYSSLLNLLTLMVLTCHLVYLSQRLR